VGRNGTVINHGGHDTLGAGASGTIMDLTYTVTNTGTADLHLNNPVITAGANVNAFLLTPPAATVAGGWDTTFTVRCIPTAPGPFDFTVSMGSNSQFNNPYTWTAGDTAGTGPPPAPPPS